MKAAQISLMDELIVDNFADGGAAELGQDAEGRVVEGRLWK